MMVGNGHRREAKPEPSGGGLPAWLTSTVILVSLGLLSWNVIINGKEGYPTTVILGGLLGTYGGVNELLRRRGGEK